MKNKSFRLTTRSLFWLKCLMHTIGLLPIIYLVLLVLNDKAGGDPVQYIIHFTGIGALKYFSRYIINLADSQAI